VLDLSSIDLEEIASALADQTDYEHQWLINPETGEIASGRPAPESTDRRRSTSMSWTWSSSIRCRPGCGIRTWPTSSTE
jgi:hypothetical protein